jgi:hypothetical protein
MEIEDKFHKDIGEHLAACFENKMNDSQKPAGDDSVTEEPAFSYIEETEAAM